MPLYILLEENPLLHKIPLTEVPCPLSSYGYWISFIKSSKSEILFVGEVKSLCGYTPLSTTPIPIPEPDRLVFSI